MEIESGTPPHFITPKKKLVWTNHRQWLTSRPKESGGKQS